jgi:hypothetical protein
MIPACLLLEIAAARFHFPLITLLNGHVFGDGHGFSPSLVFAVAALVVFFYPSTLLLGVPVALVLRHMGKASISGLMASPLVVVAIFSLTGEDPDIKIVLAYCAITVSAGCWWIHRMLGRRAQMREQEAGNR